MSEKETFTPRPDSLEARVQKLEKGKKPHQSKKSKTEHLPTVPAAKTEDRIAAALHDLRRSSSEDPAADDFRQQLFTEMEKLIPIAISQAKKGKPALLRILTRFRR